MSILLDKNTRALVQGITGKIGRTQTKWMLEYGTRVVAGVTPGKGGEMVKQIGTAARMALEAHFETRVFLDLHVKVKSEWRNDERVLDEITIQNKGSSG